VSFHPPRRRTRVPPSLILLSLVAAACACTAWTVARRRRAPTSSEATLADGSLVARDSDSLAGWTAETFALPPEFAPDLPRGRESLLFAPGWSDSRAAGFWSYAFVMWIDEPAPSPARVEDLLQDYYDGLMSSFAAAKGKDAPRSHARIDRVRSATSFVELRMRLVDSSATSEPVDLLVVVDLIADTGARTILQIQVSPQPKEHATWRSLQEAIARIMSSDAALRRGDASEGPGG
jgi:hypothetical protein